MIVLFTDYFRMNRAMWMRDFRRILFFLLLGVVGLAIRLPVTNGHSYSFTFIVGFGILAVAVAGAFVALVGILDAVGKASRLASDAGQSLRQYVDSDAYRSRGICALKRTDKQRKWL